MGAVARPSPTTVLTNEGRGGLRRLSIQRNGQTLVSAKPRQLLCTRRPRYDRDQAIGVFAYRLATENDAIITVCDLCPRRIATRTVGLCGVLSLNRVNESATCVANMTNARRVVRNEQQSGNTGDDRHHR